MFCEWVNRATTPARQQGEPKMLATMLAPELGWTEDQLARARKVIADEAIRARVVARALPIYGPVDGKEVAVPNLWLQAGFEPAPPPAQRLNVNSAPGTFLATISANVYLPNHEVADPEQQAALAKFRKAATMVAKVEDALLLGGQPGAGLPPVLPSGPPVIVQVGNGGDQPGLLPIAHPIGGRRMITIFPPRGGEEVFSAIVRAVNQLETRGHHGPYACLLSNALFEAVCTPAPTFVLPKDRIAPFLEEGPLVRSGVIPNGLGLVVATGSAPVEVVVARDIGVRYMQTTPNALHVFRVSERVALRIKEESAIAVLV
jgi:uncharacterized linocin/CFP29 family protein